MMRSNPANIVPTETNGGLRALILTRCLQQPLPRSKCSAQVASAVPHMFSGDSETANQNQQDRHSPFVPNSLAEGRCVVIFAMVHGLVKVEVSLALELKSLCNHVA